MADDNPLLRLLRGRASVTEDLNVHLSERDGRDLHAKLRQAYWWIINNAVITPYYDIEFGVHSTLHNAADDELHLPSKMSYSSFVLLPLLTLITARRALMVGGPGRGKTTSAVLMAMLAGATPEEIRKSILRGHPQLTITDLLGSPLPSDMLEAESADDIQIAWRSWIQQRVKIIDEYNRIPTKTQSALLSLMAEGYAEMFDQYIHTGRSAWFLTANDDAGGGTFQVIEALKDRIDVVVRAVPFNSAFIDALLNRIEAGKSPEDMIPTEILFSEDELDAIYEAVKKVEVPQSVLQRLSFFMGQLDFCRMASPRFEYKSKDVLKLAGKSVAQVCNEDCPLDKKVALCTQTENGVSARIYLTTLHYAKAIAYFRGHDRVELEDIRQIVPWVLHDKIVPNPRSPYFQTQDGRGLLRDRVAWLTTMIDMALEQYDFYKAGREEVAEERQLMDEGLDGVALGEVGKRLGRITSMIRKRLQNSDLTGPIYEDLIHLKSLYSRYKNYESWLEENQRT